jgi:hypothetical protein
VERARIDLPPFLVRFRGKRLYQLIRQTGRITDRKFEIEVLESGSQAFAFTFG